MRMSERFENYLWNRLSSQKLNSLNSSMIESIVFDTGMATIEQVQSKP